jgi:uncharacterized protein (DUF924 family)
MSNARPGIGAEAVLNFWFNESKPRQWFRRSDAFDAVVRDRFGALTEQACAGGLGNIERIYFLAVSASDSRRAARMAGRSCR